MDRTETLQGENNPRDPHGVPASLSLTLLHYAKPELEGMIVSLAEPAVFGRSLSGDVSVEIDADAHASRVHARVTRAEAEGAATLEDLGSRNGTFVNGIRVEQTTLRAGDIVRIGGTIFEFGYPERGRYTGVGGALVGRSAAFARMMQQVSAFAPASAAVLIRGESGTGKELFAARVHQESRRPGRLVAVNCAAISEALFESALFGHRRGGFTGATQDATGFFSDANSGTLFLDEVGELPLALQAKFLRVLESGEFFAVGSSSTLKADVRIVSATNADLTTKIARGEFREDLYARLATAVMHVAPLRERRLDIMPLARHFAGGFGAVLDWEPAFVEKLLLHSWPRNIRELKAAIQVVALQRKALRKESMLDLLVEALDSDDASVPPLRTLTPARPKKRRISEDALRGSLLIHSGNIAKVADHLGKQRKQIYRLMQRLGLSLDSFRKPGRPQ